MSTKIKAIESTAGVETPAASEAHKASAAAHDGVAKAVAGFEQTQAKLKLGMEKAVKTAEEVINFNQGNVDALIKSSQIWAAGLQDLSKAWAASAQTSMTESISTFKAMTAVKSLKEAIDLQANMVRASMEKAVAESGKFTDASVKLAEQAMAPITARVTLAVETFSKTSV